MTLCWYSVAIPLNAPKKTNAAVPTMSVSLTHGERSSGKLCANTNQPIISNCALLDKNEKGRYCKGIACEFSHSQQELDHWSKNVECRESKGKLLEVCRNGQKCKFGKGCSYAHSQKEMQIWMEGTYCMFLVGCWQSPAFYTTWRLLVYMKLSSRCSYWTSTSVQALYWWTALNVPNW